MSGRKCPAIGQAVVEDDLLPICIAQPFGDLTAENRLEQLVEGPAFPEARWLSVTMAEMPEVIGTGAEHRMIRCESQAKAEAPSPLQRASQSPGNCPSVAVGAPLPE